MTEDSNCESTIFVGLVAIGAFAAYMAFREKKGEKKDSKLRQITDGKVTEKPKETVTVEGNKGQGTFVKPVNDMEKTQDEIVNFARQQAEAVNIAPPSQASPPPTPQEIDPFEYGNTRVEDDTESPAPKPKLGLEQYVNNNPISEPSSTSKHARNKEFEKFTNPSPNVNPAKVQGVHRGQTGYSEEERDKRMRKNGYSSYDRRGRVHLNPALLG